VWPIEGAYGPLIENAFDVEKQVGGIDGLAEWFEVMARALCILDEI
jgi:hypothetical protein